MAGFLPDLPQYRETAHELAAAVAAARVQTLWHALSPMVGAQAALEPENADMTLGEASRGV